MLQYIEEYSFYTSHQGWELHPYPLFPVGRSRSRGGWYWGTAIPDGALFPSSSCRSSSSPAFPLRACRRAYETLLLPLWTYRCHHLLWCRGFCCIQLWCPEQQDRYREIVSLFSKTAAIWDIPECAVIDNLFCIDHIKRKWTKSSILWLFVSA